MPPRPSSRSAPARHSSSRARVPDNTALGYAWVALLAFVALSSFGIHTIRLWGPFSPIQLLSLLTLASLVLAVDFARNDRIEAHRQSMLWVYAMALVLTGMFTLWPGRVMHEVLFGA